MNLTEFEWRDKTIKDHGKISVKVQGRVVNSYPSESFNEFGVKLAFQKIREAAFLLDYWVLVGKPVGSLGLTPEALVELGIQWKKLPENGCVGIGLNIPSSLLKGIL